METYYKRGYISEALKNHIENNFFLHYYDSPMYCRLQRQGSYSHRIENINPTVITHTTEHPITAVQQIMIGTLCNNYDNALATLRAMKNAGYEAIELNDFMIQKTSLLVRLMKKFSGMPIGKSGNQNWDKLIKESGLKVISLHID